MKRGAFVIILFLFFILFLFLQKNTFAVNCNPSVQCNCSSNINESGTITLTSDLPNATGQNVCTGATGLFVNASNVILNCAGFSIRGKATASSKGIDWVASKINVTIKNCNILNWTTGLNFGVATSNNTLNTNNFSAITSTAMSFGGTADDINVTNNTFFKTTTTDVSLASGSDKYTIEKNTFTGAQTAISFAGTSVGTKVLGNIINAANGISLASTSVVTFCEAYGNYYNASVAISRVIPSDCGPQPALNVSVNSSITTSNFSFGETNTIPTYKTVGEAIYNVNASRNILFVNPTGPFVETGLQFIRNTTIFDCNGAKIDTKSGTGILLDTVTDITIQNCLLNTSTANRIIQINTQAYRNIIQNNNITTTTSGSAIGVYFGVDTNNNNNITNNTFYGTIGTSISGAASGKPNATVYGNKFHSVTPISTNVFTLNFCPYGYGNYYNETGSSIPGWDCGPQPALNVSVNSSISSSNFSFGETNTIPTYKTVGEAIFNVNASRNILFVNPTGPFVETGLQFIRNKTIFDCNGAKIDTKGGTGIILDTVTDITIQNCLLNTSSANSIIRFNTQAFRNVIINNNITTTTQGTATGVYFGVDTNNNNNITNNTFYGTIGASISGAVSGKPNATVYGNKFHSVTPVDTDAFTLNFCPYGYGNYYNETATPGNVPTKDCGPEPALNVSVNSSISSSNFSFGETNTIPTYKTVGEAIFNVNASRNILFVNPTGPFVETGLQFIRNKTIFDCNGAKIDTKGGTGIILDTVTDITIQNCLLNTSSANSIIRFNTQAYRNLIINNNITTTTSGTATGVYFGVDTNNNNNITNNTFYGTIGASISGAVSGKPNATVYGNKFHSVTPVDTDAFTLNFCPYGYGNYYNESTGTGNTPLTDCGPCPSINLTVNKSISSSTFTFENNTLCTFKTIQEGYYNTNISRSVIIANGSGTYSFSSTGVTPIKENITLECNWQIINQTAGTATILLDLNALANNVIHNCIFSKSTHSSGALRITGTASKFNVITNNNFSSNAVGVYIDSLAQFNNITKNNFYGTTTKPFRFAVASVGQNKGFWNDIFDVFNASSENTTNMFNTSTVGNYWASYNTSGAGCNDSDGDGICDIPKNISNNGATAFNGKDFFARLAPWNLDCPTAFAQFKGRGQTTNFDLLTAPQLGNYSGAVLQRGGNNATINFTNSRNFCDKNLDENIVIDEKFISVYTTLTTDFRNATSQLSFVGNFTNYDFKTQFIVKEANNNTLVDIQADGMNCFPTRKCTLDTKNDTRLIVNVTSFSSYAVSSSTNLSIANNGPKNAGINISFNASYINATDGTFITSAQCNITYNQTPIGGTANGPYTMNQTTNKYERNDSFNIAGRFSYNISCQKGGYTTLFINDTSSVSGGLIGINVTDNIITFGGGGVNTTATIAVLDSNNVSYTNWTFQKQIEDFFMIENTGNVRANLTVSIGNLPNANQLFCSNGCVNNLSKVEIKTLENETGSCINGLQNNYTTIMNSTANLSLTLCDNFDFTNTNNTLKVYVRFTVPVSPASGTKNLTFLFTGISLQ